MDLLQLGALLKKFCKPKVSEFISLVFDEYVGRF